MLKWVFQIFKIVLLLFLPFIILIRGAVFLYISYDWPSWMALLGGAFGAALSLIIYFSFFYGKITGRVGDVGSFKRRSVIAMIMVLGYCIHGLLFLSTNNTKSSKVRDGYHSVHPILRMGASTVAFIDPDLIITSTDRVPEDYKRMGLPTKRHSLHYHQSNGYAHAIDLRTNGHSIIRNLLLRTYFSLMGFNTLRHVGTDDHLHVSLSSKDVPGAI